MGQITVRPARRTEAQALTTLCMRSKAHWGYDPDFMRLSAVSLTVTEDAIAAGDVLVAEDEAGRRVGVAAIAPLADEGVYDLDKLFVDPAALRSGIGHRIFDAVVRLARKRGARSLMILADPNAAPFYARMGAVWVRDAPSDAIPGRTLPLYRLEL